MRNRIQQFALMALGLFVVGVWTSCFLAPRHRIDEHSYRRIKKGMTLAEAEAIIGVPPGVYTQRSTEYKYHRGPPFKTSVAELLEAEKLLAPEIRSWYGNAGFIWVEFDEDGRVYGVSILENPHPPNFVDKVKAWLGW